LPEGEAPLPNDPDLRDAEALGARAAAALR
jgi:hypothetical protein